MDLEEEKNLVIRITKFGLNKQKFTLNELYENLNTNQDDQTFIDVNLVRKRYSSSDSPNHIIGYAGSISGSQSDVSTNHYFSLLPNALYNYVDYLEIKVARTHAEEANKKSNIAIGVSIAALIASVVLGIIQILVSIK
jgi:hypothetical protein